MYNNKNKNMVLHSDLVVACSTFLDLFKSDYYSRNHVDQLFVYGLLKLDRTFKFSKRFIILSPAGICMSIDQYKQQNAGSQASYYPIRFKSISKTITGTLLFGLIVF